MYHLQRGPLLDLRFCHADERALLHACFVAAPIDHAGPMALPALHVLNQATGYFEAGAPANLALLPGVHAPSVPPPPSIIAISTRETTLRCMLCGFNYRAHNNHSPALLQGRTHEEWIKYCHRTGLQRCLFRRRSGAGLRRAHLRLARPRAALPAHLPRRARRVQRLCGAGWRPAASPSRSCAPWQRCVEASFCALPNQFCREPDNDLHVPLPSPVSHKAPRVVASLHCLHGQLPVEGSGGSALHGAGY